MITWAAHILLKSLPLDSTDVNDASRNLETVWPMCTMAELLNIRIPWILKLVNTDIIPM